jgi:hypothetical protein
MKVKFVAVVGLAAFIAFGVMTASAQGNRTVLRIDSVKITKTECGKPLEFQIVIKNAGAQGYNKETAILIKRTGNQIGHVFVMSIGAGQTITDIQSSLNQDFLADCCKEVCFEVSLAANLNGGDVPEWNKVPFKLCTKPGNVVVVPGR